MTFVIRITLSLLAVITLVSLTAEADAQIFRRLRDNLRGNYPPQGPPAPRPQRPVQIAPQPQGQYGQPLTPYSRLSAAQRSAAAAQNASPSSAPRPSRVSRKDAAQPNANPEQVNVRVVTYYDPRTGRTFQRRYLLPANRAGDNQMDNGQTGEGQMAGRNAPDAGGRNLVYDKIPKPAVPNPRQQLSRSNAANSNAANSSVANANVANANGANLNTANNGQPKFVIPPLRNDQMQSRISQAPVNNQQLPILAGPSVVAAKPATASPVYRSPTTQLPQAEPGMAIANAPIVVREEIRVDTSVAPATATSPTNASNNIGLANTDDGGPVAYSVLESDDDAVAETKDADAAEFDIEINSADEVEEFFGN